MPNDERMTVDERYKYLRAMQRRYQQAKRGRRSLFLDDMVEITGLHRKSLLRLMGGAIERRVRQRQRGKWYDREVKEAVAAIAQSLDWICAERVQPVLVETAERMERDGELELSAAVRSKLATVSIATVQRLLVGVPRDPAHLPRPRREPANGLAREIPAQRIPWDEPEAGHFEVDLVHHSGPSASGQYVHTLQMVDVATGWSERVAVLGRSYLVIQDAFQRVLERLPFPVREVHPDNGSEFLNHHLVRFWGARASGVILTRSRPWQKNDNRFVEQKNSSLVRAYLGHDRLDTVQQTQLLNRLYELMGLYYNLFQPVMRLVDKSSVVASDGSHRTKRRFDVARTPSQRLCASAALDPHQRQQLETLREGINHCQLRRDIYALLDQLDALPPAAPELGPQDVYLTLSHTPEEPKGEDSTPATLSIE